MQSMRAGLVDIVREFLMAHQAIGKLFERFRDGSLRFHDIEDLIGDGENSLLFRLKERCHALFRGDERGSGTATAREALFDLAIGSLFHEAMKFRENLYQQEIYAPRVQKLRSEAGDEADELFQEFGKILSAARVRLEEALQETEALLTHTRDQFRLLLGDNREQGLIVRYLIEQSELVSEVYSQDFESFLAEVYGVSGEAYLVAARSYLQSAHFEAARIALGEARARLGEPFDLARLSAYAEGMQAFLEGRYEASLEHLSQWLDAQPGVGEADFAALALTALSRLSHLVDEKTSDASSLVARSSKLARRIEAVVGAAPVG